MKRVDSIALTMAKRYKRRCWWADLDDMTQEARTALLEALRTADPQSSVPVDGYLWRVAAFRIRAFLWKNSAPVNAPWHKMTELRGVHRAELSPLIEDDSISAPKTIDERQWRERVRARLADLASRVEDGFLAKALLLEEQGTRTDKSLNKARSRLKKDIRNDFELYELWREAPSL
jgi:DNA-directed RNA polymerase specialized sigma subunit